MAPSELRTNSTRLGPRVFEAIDEFQHLSWVQDMVQIKGRRKLTYYPTGNEFCLEEAATLGPEDKDRRTTGVRGRHGALMSCLRWQMLESPGVDT